ncbi:MAG: FtsX-like permease family protein [Planctomycetes bacterium]|nr:FtsX-like permease family protein [Planctomycetota bacterium]
MSLVPALRALLRAEGRSLRRDRARSGLIVLLVAVPVAAMAGGSALFATVRRTPDEARASVLGAADLRLDAPATRARVAQLLPEASEFEPLRDRRADVSAPGAHSVARAVDLASGALEPQRLARGYLRVVEGRAPASAGEAGASPTLLAELRQPLGGTIRLDGESARVVGVVVDPEDLAAPLVLRAHDPARDGPAPSWLARIGNPEEAAARLRSRGAGASARSELGGEDGFETAALLVLGGFAFFEAALVVAAAFAVGLRRRQRELGLLGACGATRAGMHAAIAASALLLSGAGTAIGLVVGLGAAGAAVPFIDDWNGRANGELEFPLRLLATATALGLLMPLAAVLLPAIGATRLPVRVALSAQRPVAEGTRGWMLLGGGLLGCGLSCVAWGAQREGPEAGLGILLGSALAVLGLGAASPWILGLLARAAAPLPLAWRLAARDAGRFRARNAPVVTAVLAGSSVTLLFAVLAASVEEFLRARGQSGDTESMLFVALAACFVTSLVVVLAATALSTAESAADARVLRAVGADPRVLRVHAGARAAYLALLGAALAIPGGLVPGAGLLELASGDLPFRTPWREIALVVIALPASAFALAWILAQRVSRGIRARAARD